MERGIVLLIRSLCYLNCEHVKLLRVMVLCSRGYFVRIGDQLCHYVCIFTYVQPEAWNYQDFVTLLQYALESEFPERLVHANI